MADWTGHSFRSFLERPQIYERRLIEDEVCLKTEHKETTQETKRRQNTQ